MGGGESFFQGRDIRRVEYEGKTLLEGECEASPYDLFKIWEQEEDALATVPALCVLSTVHQQGGADSRVVLCRLYSNEKFIFFTDYRSIKGQQIQGDNRVSLLFYWPSGQRQVRVRGQAHRISREDSEDYFSSRPHESQVSAHISHQSQVISHRRILEKSYENFEEDHRGEELSCPSFWGGISVEADEIEFWQGRPYRLHDRILYQRRKEGEWGSERLSP